MRKRWEVRHHSRQQIRLPRRQVFRRFRRFDQIKLWKNSERDAPTNQSNSSSSISKSLNLRVVGGAERAGLSNGLRRQCDEHPGAWSAESFVGENADAGEITRRFKFCQPPGRFQQHLVRSKAAGTFPVQSVRRSSGDRSGGEQGMAARWMGMRS